MRVLVTGAFGFIGSYFIKYLLSVDPDVQVVGFGRNSDQKNMRRLPRHLRLAVVYGDLTDRQSMSGLCEHVDVVVNFAARTFVDHSLKDPHPFIQSNVIGADNIMEDATRYGVKRFVQVSTDEVYGQILVGAYDEGAKLDPRNPYAWTKACADLDALQRHRTYGFPAIVTRTENNFGPWQHRQKALPTFVRCAVAGEPIPVYGDGLHVRCWLHVEEHCRAIWYLVRRSMQVEPTWSHQIVGEVFHVAGSKELTNLALARLVLSTLGKDEGRIKFIPDHDVRPGHDRRYALDCTKLRDVGFRVKQDLTARLKETISWYADHQEWMR